MAAVLGLAGISSGQPCDIVPIGSYGGKAQSVTLAGSIAYVAQDVGGLYLYDVSDPAAPRLLSQVDFPGEAMRVSIVGEVAFIASGSGGLCTIDVSDAMRPALLGRFDSPGEGHDVAVVDGVAYLADAQGGLSIIDASDPAELRSLGTISEIGRAVGVEVDGSLAYVALETSGLAIIDVSDPSAPALAGSYWTGRCFSVAVDETIVYCGAASDLFALDVSDPQLPQLLSRTYLGSGHIVDLSRRDDLLYVASEVEGLAVFDIADPSAPAAIGSLFHEGYTRGLGVDGSLACLAQDLRGIVMVGIGDPAAPVALSVHPTLATAEAVVVRDRTAYVADYGFASLDVSDPRRPRLLAWLDVGEPLSRLHLAGDLAFAISGFRMYIISIVDPSAPELLGVFEPPNHPSDVHVIGGVAHLTGGHGLMCVDIGAPSAPAQLGLLRLPRGSAQLDVAGSMAVVANDTRMYLIDVSDPAAPVEAANLSSGVLGLTAVKTVDDLSYFAARRWGMAIVDTAARPPRLLATLELLDDARDIVMGDGVAFFADGAAGVTAADITQPVAPDLIGQFDTPGRAVGLAMQDDLMYVADSAGGLRILDVAGCRACLADCDGDGELSFFDYLCFTTAFAEAGQWADCDRSGVLDFLDFLCFQEAFVAGCE